MSVQIIINGENALQSIEELSTLAAGLFGRASVQPVQQEVEAPKTTTRKATQQKATEQPKEEPVVQKQAVQSDEDSGDGDEHIPTDEELRAKAMEKGKSAGKEKIKALLDKYECANLTGVPKDMRVAFMRDLEAL